MIDFGGHGAVGRLLGHPDHERINQKAGCRQWFLLLACHHSKRNSTNLTAQLYSDILFIF